MPFKPAKIVVALLPLPLMMAGCNSNENDTATASPSPVAMQTLTVTPSLGKITNARVVLRNASTHAQIGATQALVPGGSGQASFTVPRADLVGQPILAEVLPAAAGDVSYIDETDNLPRTITINAANRDTPLLHAVVTPTNSTTNIGITALTDAAFRQLPTTAMTPAQALTAINAANASVKAQLGLSYEVYTAPVLNYGDLVNNSLASSQRAYAAYLAALAKQGKFINPASATPAYEMAQSLAADLADGTFNGSANGQPLPLAYNNAFVQQWMDIAAAIVANLDMWTNTAMLEAYLTSVQHAIEQAGGYDLPHNCSTSGADDKLGFANAPVNFCGFTRGSSTALSSPDIYTFQNGNQEENVKVTVAGGVVSQILAENNTYAFSCGTGGDSPACTGVTIHSSAGAMEFVFSNTVLLPLSGQGQSLTVTNGSLIHPVTVIGGGTTTGGSPSTLNTQGTYLGGSNVAPTTGANDFKLVILTDGVPPFGHASKIAFSGTHAGGTKSISALGFATQADLGTFTATSYAVNGYSVDVVGQEIRINAGGYRCNFDANKPFTVFGNSTNGVAVSYQTALTAAATCNVQMEFTVDNVLTTLRMTQNNSAPTATNPYSIEIAMLGL